MGSSAGVRVSDSFHIFALTAEGNVLGGEENCLGGELSEGSVSERECPIIRHGRDRVTCAFTQHCSEEQAVRLGGRHNMPPPP